MRILASRMINVLGVICCLSGAMADWRTVFPKPGEAKIVDIQGCNGGQYIAVDTLSRVIWFDGDAWLDLNASQEGNFSSVWQSSKDEIFAVGTTSDSKGFICRWDGTEWSNWKISDDIEFNDVIGFEGMVFVCGSGGLIYQFNGSSWSQTSTGITANLTSIWGTGLDNLWVVGENGTIMRWIGGTWVPQSQFVWKNIKCIYGTGPSDIYASIESIIDEEDLLYHFDGITWSSVEYEFTDQIVDMWGSGQNDLYAVTSDYFGSTGTTQYHFDGHTWDVLPFHINDSMTAVSGNSETDVFLCGYKCIVRKKAGDWLMSGVHKSTGFSKITGYSDSNIYAIDNNQIAFHWDGMQWQSVMDFQSINSIGVFADGIVKSTPMGIASSEFGGDWQNLTGGGDSGMLAFWGSSIDEWFAVGESGSSFCLNNGSMRILPTGISEDLYAIWGASSGDVYAGGGNSVTGVLIHWNGAQWEKLQPTVERKVISIWGFSGDSVYVLEETGRVLHWNGSEWVVLDDVSTSSCIGMCGRSETEIYVVDVMGYFYRWDGISWDQLTRFDGPVVDFWGDSTKLFIISNDGIYIWSGSSWQNVLEGEYYQYKMIRGGGSAPFIVAGTCDELLEDTKDGWKIRSLDCSEIGSYSLTDVWSDGSTLIFIGDKYGDGVIAKRFEGYWEVESSDDFPGLHNIFGYNKNEIYVSGGSAVIKWDGTSWSAVPSTIEDYVMDIWGPAPGILYVMTSSSFNSNIWLWKNSAWSITFTFSIFGDPMALWGSSENDIFIVGDRGYTAHYNGEWNEISLSQDTNLKAISGSPSQGVFAAGDWTIAQWNGASWQVKDQYPFDSTDAYASDSKRYITSSNRGILQSEKTTCSTMGMTLEMPAHHFTPYESCYLHAIMCNPEEEIAMADVFIVLEVAGYYFFYPSWCMFPSQCPGADREIRKVPHGESMIEIIPAFAWPEGVGSANGLVFYGAITTFLNEELLGEIGIFEFGYGE